MNIGLSKNVMRVVVTNVMSERWAWEYFPSSRWKSRRGTDNVSNFSALDRNNDIPDPQDALPLELAQKVANGHMMPQEARRLIRELQQQLFTLATESLTSTTTANNKPMHRVNDIAKSIHPTTLQE